jgi:hypothetical protein
LACAWLTFIAALLVGWPGAVPAEAQSPPDEVCVSLLTEVCVANPVDLPPEPDQVCAQLLLEHCVNNPAMILDEEGDAPTAPFIPGDPRAAGGMPPLGEITGAILAYADGQIGPLSADAAAALEGLAPPDQGAMSHAPTSTGSCDFRGPNLYRLRDTDRAKRGDPSYFYGAQVSQECTTAVASANCYTELWRARDSAVLDTVSRTDNGERPGTCWADAYSNYYVRPNKHYSKHALQATTKPGGFWGSGRGPRGWDCSGQGTRTLTCRRDTAPQS